jgi:hypothetical protein
MSIHPGGMRTYIFGDLERMKNAKLDPSESAQGIINLITTKTEVDGNIYLDYEGKGLPW